MLTMWLRYRSMTQAACRWMHPLQITLPQTIIPIVGSILGWLMGVSALPSGAPTWIGGALLIAATVLVIMAGHKREARELALQRQSRDVQLPEVRVVLSKPAEGRPHGDHFWEDDEPDASTGLAAQKCDGQGKAASVRAAGPTVERGAEHAEGAQSTMPTRPILDAEAGLRGGVGMLRHWLGWYARRRRWGQIAQDSCDGQEASGLLSRTEQTELSDAVPEQTSGQQQLTSGHDLETGN